MSRKRKNQDENPTQNGGPNAYARIDSPKYGSVTKEVEALTAERHRVANFFAKLNSIVPLPTPNPNPNPDGLSPVSNSYNKNNPFGKSSGLRSSISINLDDDDEEEREEEKIVNEETERELEVKKEIITEEKNKGEIIVIDSDDENEYENVDTNGLKNENTPTSSLNPTGSDMNSLVQSSSFNLTQNQLTSPCTEVQNQFTSSNSNFSQNQLMNPEMHNQFATPLAQLSPSPRANPHLFRIGSFQPPSVLYSKVVLQDVAPEQREKDRQVAESVEKRSELIPQTNSISKTYERKNRKIRSDLPKTNLKKQDESSPKSQLESQSEMESPVQEDEEMEVDEDYEEERREKREKESESDDQFEDLWKDMNLALEYSKAEEKKNEEEKEEEEEIGDDDVCGHVFLLQDDVGLVCRVCGVIQKKIDKIFEFTFKNSKRAGRSFYEPNKPRQEKQEFNFSSLNLPEDDFSVYELYLHPRHSRNIKPHQKEGFDFLVKNLVCENPGGCILAHAPGSGKTFMLIAFIQSFLAKYPTARPMVVLPKGILSTWKKEFQRWQVEETLLLDFYSSKAEKRSEQLQILNQWKDKRSILFLGYQQFASIICDNKNGKVGSACQEMLLKVPGLLIIDEGHTPRNEDTNVLGSLAKVQTKRKVVLSGTLFQNHVNEVFNILNLVRPKFLKTESAQCIVKRILSRVSISGSRRLLNENVFFDLVEDALRSNDSFNRKIRVIQDLRELTHNVLHYYKGDFLDELPGLVDLTVMLKMTKKQEENLKRISNYDKFKRTSVSTAIYMHPKLSEISEISFTERAASCTDSKMDALVEDINIREGSKMKIFINVLNLAESAGEKCLAFSQYIVPLKFLERYLVHTKGWRVGKEIFVISGDSSSDDRERSMEQFNKSSEAKVLFGSIKACGEGISLVGASRVIILDVHINPSVTRQAIGRAFRPGQEKKVFVYRLVAVDSPEVKVHQTSFRKELISKMWFEWSEFGRDQEFELDELSVEESGDLFLENFAVKEDIKSLYKR